LLKTPDKWLDTLRLTPRQSEELLDSLGAPGEALAFEEQRANTRLFFTDLDGVGLQVSHPGGSEMYYRVVPADLSEEGMRVLHGAYMHAGSPVNAMVKDVRGLQRRLPGKVVRCEHHAGRIHVLGIQFAEAIRLADFVRIEEAKPCQLAGRVLHVDDSDDFRRMFAFHVGKLGVAIDGVGSVDEAIQRAGSVAYDAIYVDLHLGHGTGIELIEALRDDDYTGPIVLLTGDESDAVIQQAEAAGAAEVLIKPIKPDAVKSSMVRHLLGGTGGDDQPIQSSLWEDVSARPIIEQLCAGLPVRLNLLEQMVRQDNGEWRSHARDLRCETGDFGFPQLADAFRALEALDSTADGAIYNLIGDARALIKRVERGLA
jgi:CheY-like chemotaxis protein